MPCKITGSVTKERIREIALDTLINYSGVDDNRGEDLKKLGDQVNLKADFEIDDLDIYGVIDELEVRLGIIISEDDVSRMTTVGHLITAIETSLRQDGRIE